MDKVALRIIVFRQIEPLKQLWTDDFPFFRALSSFDNVFALKLEELFARRQIYAAPTFEVLKEELTTHRLKKEALEDKIESLTTNQREIQNAQSGMQNRLNSVVEGQAEMRNNIN